MSAFKDSGHLFRYVALFVVGTLCFLVIRHFAVPKTFGEYGHYRGAAIGEIAAHPIHFAGHETCESCHADVLDKKKDGKHAHVNCEACHGPLAKHAEAMTNGDASVPMPTLPDTAVLCIRCHSESAARPRGFPQVKAEEHSGGVPCQTCHQPHNPAIQAEATPAAKDATGGKK